MVGVPRSKGCLACLQRRVKCDETQPKCHSCQRRGQSCPGYTRDRKFYHRFATSSQREPSKPTISLARSPKLSTALIVTQQTQRGTPSSRASMDEAVVPGLVVRTLEEQCRRGFCDFVDTVFPNIYYSYSSRMERPWFDVVHNQQGTAKLLDCGLCSLGSLQLGRANGNQRLILASQEMYGRGLCHLVQALKNPTTAGKDDTLGAAILFGIYELINATVERSWLLHSRGISHLFRLRGPKSHVGGFGRTLLLSFRGILVFEAFIRGEACFLESEEWRSILPQIVKDEEQRGMNCHLGILMDCAFNEIAQCPGFLVKTKALVASSRTTNVERERLALAINNSKETLIDVETQMLAGIKADLQGNEKVCQVFFGLIPDFVRNDTVKFSLEGIRSGIALLHQLSVVLLSDQARNKETIPWMTLGPGHNEWEIIKDNDGLARIAQAKTRIHPTGPQQTGSAKLWPDRIALAMGMPEKD